MLLRLLWVAGRGVQWAADGQGGKPADPCTRTWGVPSAFLRLPGALMGSSVGRISLIGSLSMEVN